MSFFSKLTGADKATGAAKKANAQMLAFAKQARADLNPWMQFGQGFGLGGLAELYGQTYTAPTITGYYDPRYGQNYTLDSYNALLETKAGRKKAKLFNPVYSTPTFEDTGQAFDLSSLPGFSQGLDWGLDAVSRRLAAGGSGGSGNELFELFDYGQKYARDAWQQEWANRFNLATMGQNAATGAGQALISGGQSGANALVAGGNAAAGALSGFWGNAISGVSQGLGVYAGLKK